MAISSNSLSSWMIRMTRSSVRISVILFLTAILSSNTNNNNNNSAGLLFVAAQQPDSSLCACSPSSYKFTLDFSLTCPPVNVTKNGGIAATFCQISPFGTAESNITDLVPVEVGYIDVLELGQNFEVLTQDNITSSSSDSDPSFQDGDSFEYTSIVISNPENDQIPKVIQLNIFGRNAAGEPVVNFFAIAYSNDCDEYPTLLQGESAGWTQFTKLEPPIGGSCPAASLPTGAPTDAPERDEPTSSPTGTVTDAPSDSPETGVPTDGPTEANEDSGAPTLEPTETKDTDAPTSSPSEAKATDVPTPEPTEKEVTNPPTPEPTDTPEFTMPPSYMSMSMSMSMSMNMMETMMRTSLRRWDDIQYGADKIELSNLSAFGAAFTTTTEKSFADRGVMRNGLKDIEKVTNLEEETRRMMDSIMMSLSMSMSMSMPMDSDMMKPSVRSKNLRAAKIGPPKKNSKSAKLANVQKVSYKWNKKNPGGKAGGKFGKFEKKSKAAKSKQEPVSYSLKKTKKTKEAKDLKSKKEYGANTGRRRRRLRVHQVD